MVVVTAVVVIAAVAVVIVAATVVVVDPVPLVGRGRISNARTPGRGPTVRCPRSCRRVVARKPTRSYGRVHVLVNDSNGPARTRESKYVMAGLIFNVITLQW